MRTSSTWKHSILLLAIAVTIVGCSGGGSGESQTIPDDTGAALNDATILYSKQPRLNEELTFSIKEHSGSAQSYAWSVLEEPAGANLVLTPVPAKNAVKFTPTVAGDYRLRVSSDTESATTNFYIDPRFPFLVDKVALYEGSFSDETYVGRVDNQVWLYSRTLNRQTLEQLAAQYPTFQVIGFDPVNGLLLQFDELNPDNGGALKDIKLTSGVVSVVNRVVAGDMVVEENEVTPDDGSSFNDGGDNWHLERIGAEQAWDISTGSSDILVGISESKEKFFVNHEDLIGRFGSTLEASSGDSSHPSAMAGAIGAISDNGKGISGINWVTKMSTGDSGEDELRRLAGSGSTKVINSSWALVVSAPPEGTDMEDESVRSAREQLAFDLTRGYRKLMREYPNHLFVNSAGNGVKGPDGTATDGRYHSPALQYTEIGTLNPVPNALFVAAMQEDGRLRESSNYGESVQIAAPNGYKSIEGENGYDTIFGTSAASAVVTGVASLIYSVNPNFSAHTVKQILLSTATDFVTERHTESGNNGTTESLSNPIPVVNAAAAVKLAEQLAAGLKAEVIQSFDNPFSNIMNIQVLSATGEMETASFEYSLNDTTGNASGSEARIGIKDSTIPLTLSSSQVKFRNLRLGTIVTGEFEQALENPYIALNLFNRNSNLPVANAQITIEPVNVFNARFESANGAAGANGQTRVYLMSGAYRVIVNAAGYKEFRTLINIVNEGQRIFVNLPLTPDTDPVGTGLDSCVIGKWSIDLAHLQEQIDLSGISSLVIGDVTVRMLPDGTGTADTLLTFNTVSDINGQALESTVTQTSQSKFDWSTGNNVLFVESRGSTATVTSVVTVDGVTIPGASDEPPVTVNGPANSSSSPYACQGDRWTVEASGENTIATRFNRL